MKNNLAVNLRSLRANSKMTQEEVAERIGVSRQAVAKWETGESLPDIINCDTLADLFEVSLTDLLHHDAAKTGFGIGPKGKHIFGTVKVGERGQIVLPKEARDALQFQPGDALVVLGDTNPMSQGLALIGTETFLRWTGQGIDQLFKGGEG